ncbi:MAG TPA: hypothetical protein VND65_20510 [Candidatus Binatia bacterium]|nr:hypothetical protein [Candidatus Binatia bacterium]
MNKPAKQSHHTPEWFESRLAAYAIAATAAGVGVMAASVPSQAEVMFTPAHTTFTSGAVYLDLNHDGINDFVLSIYRFGFADKRLVASGLGRNGVLGYTGSSYGPLAAPAGYVIKAGPFFWNREAPAVNVADSFGTNASGPFANAGLCFFGLKFKINGEVHFGWAAVVAKAGGHRHAPEIETSLLGYAYETEPGKAIIAGDTGSGVKAEMFSPDPAEGSLGTLALGWRESNAALPRRRVS